MDWQAFWLTFKLAGITTVLLLILSIPLAYFLSQNRFRGKAILETLITLPLILPPTVLGFYLLLAFSPNHLPGSWLRENLGLQLVFSFEGLVMASMLYSLPFAVQPLRSGLQGIPREIYERAALLNITGRRLWLKVLFPNMRSSILTALVLCFAHTVGEFGVVLMIGGNIPGVTRVASIAVYDQVESMNYAEANQLSLILLLFSFGILLIMNVSNRNAVNWIWRKS